jgi:fermentation-respiration switch protein FrsA (DUF1100 family)
MKTMRSAIVIIASITTLSLGCSVAGPAPAVIPPAPPSLRAANVRIQSASGNSITAWVAQGEKGRGAVLLLHGVGSNRLSMLPRAEFLHRLGFAVLALDFRAHGESPGEFTTFGARESLDAAAALEFLKTIAPGERVGVIGVSMGGAAALLGERPLPVDALVLESVYPTIRDAVRDRLTAWSGPLAFVSRNLTSPVLRLIHHRTGVSESEMQPIQRIGSVRSPILFLAGSADPYTPLKEAQALFARASSPKTFWRVDGARHEDLYKYLGAEYERRVGDFLTRNLNAGQELRTASGSGASRD